MSAVRAVRDTDLPAIRDIYNHYVRESTVTFDEEETDLALWQGKREVLAASGLPFLVSVDDAGSRARLRPDAALAPEVGIPVQRRGLDLPRARRGRPAGSAAALFEALLAAAADAGLHEVIAMIEPTGAAASIALHRRYGFEDTGVLRGVGIKFGRTLDVVMLQKTLRFPEQAG